MVEQSDQQIDSGSNPTSPLQFSRCSLTEVSNFVKINHYSHSHMATILYCFKIERDRIIVGAALFGFMAGNPKASCVIEGYDDPHDYQELCRLVLLDDVPKNSESRFISWCIRWLKKNTKLIALISFADPKQGHRGTIYKASNWIYCGLQKQDRNRIFINGIEIHPRQIYNKYGTSSIKKLEQLGLQIEQSPREPKHRFVYPLRKNLTIKKRCFNGVKELG
jgi:hypothetical protein